MKNRIAVIIIWLMLIECMNLHYDYYVSDNFCGIANNIEQVKAGLHEASSLIIIKVACHILPLLYVLVIIFSDEKLVRNANLGLACAYTLFHGAHFSGEISQDPFNLIQVVLLAVTFFISCGLIFYSYQWLKEASA